jgi:hypothetical protein
VKNEEMLEQELEARPVTEEDLQKLPIFDE